MADYNDIYEEFTGKKMPGNNEIRDEIPIDDFRKFIKASYMTPFTTEFRKITGGKLELSLNAEFNSRLFTLEKIETLNQDIRDAYVTLSSEQTGTIAAFHVLGRNHLKTIINPPVILEGILIVTASDINIRAGGVTGNLAIPPQVQFSGRHNRKRNRMMGIKSVGF